MTDGGRFEISESTSPTNVTISAENLCHYITDDQLRRLGEMRKDLVMEICLAAGGVLAGSLVPAYSGWQRWQSGTATGADLLTLLLFAAALAAFAITAYQWRARNQVHTNLVAEIRNRDKVPVQHVS